MPVAEFMTGTGAPAVSGVAGVVIVPLIFAGVTATPFNVSLV